MNTIYSKLFILIIFHLDVILFIRCILLFFFASLYHCTALRCHCHKFVRPLIAGRNSFVAGQQTRDISVHQGCCRSTFEKSGNRNSDASKKIGKRKLEFRCLEKKPEIGKINNFFNVFFFQVFLILLISFQVFLILLISYPVEFSRRFF